MRVIAGNLKGKKLKGPDTDKTRPTLDRVKEAIFSIVSDKIPESTVLDLFSGSGSIAIEFISRGAKFCHINDCEKQSISTILYNIKLTNLESCVKITMNDFKKCLKKFDTNGSKFDIIFLDPPYASNYGIDTLNYISNSQNKILKNDGIIVYEFDKAFAKMVDETNFENLVCIKTKFYGRVAVKIYKWRD